MNVIALTDAHLPIGQPEEDIVELLRSLLVKAEKGDLIGFGAYWVECQNDVICSVAPGCARGALMVAGSCMLYDETKKGWVR